MYWFLCFLHLTNEIDMYKNLIQTHICAKVETRKHSGSGNCKLRVGDDGTLSDSCRSREVNDRSETTSCSCTVSSVEEDGGLAVVSTTTKAANVGVCSSRRSSTSSALCRLDKPSPRPSHLSVNSRKITGRLFSALNTFCSLRR